jgi:hypothetical protein
MNAFADNAKCRRPHRESDPDLPHARQAFYQSQLPKAWKVRTLGSRAKHLLNLPQIRCTNGIACMNTTNIAMTTQCQSASGNFGEAAFVEMRNSIWNHSQTKLAFAADKSVTSLLVRSAHNFEIIVNVESDLDVMGILHKWWLFGWDTGDIIIWCDSYLIAMQWIYDQ